MPKDILPLVAADEGLNHQIVNTFAAVGSSDLNWTEKLWTSLASRDGSLQVDFGIGKYTNRNVLDGFAGLSRGVEQWTVRGSRELSSDPESAAVGPIRYEVLEPLHQVRLRLQPNDVVPGLSFDLVFEGALAPMFEERDVQYKAARKASDVVRYHQAGSVSGAIELNGDHIQVETDQWFAMRDHSWGVRENVGLTPPDLQPRPTYFAEKYHFQWLASQLWRPDGTRYELQYYFRENEGGVDFLSAHRSEADGSQTIATDMSFDVRYRSDNRAFAGGTVHLTFPGEQRSVSLEPLSDTGFHLQTGLYLPWKGGAHGVWRGRLHTDGEYIADCDKELDTSTEHGWQVRDRPVRIRDGDAEGYGILESICYGDWPDLVGD